MALVCILNLVIVSANLKCHSDRIACLPDLNCLDHASVPQLTQNQFIVKLTGSLQ